MKVWLTVIMDDHVGGKKYAGGKWETINFIGVALTVLPIVMLYYG